MFKTMRRKRQELSFRRCEEILYDMEYGILALQEDGGYPYAVPLNYVYADGKIYFHCARSGHKLDAISKNDKVSFCVVSKSDLLVEKFTTVFESVIVFGRMRIVDDKDECARALACLVESLTPDATVASKQAELDLCEKRNSVLMLCLEPDHISGKQAKELLEP